MKKLFVASLFILIAGTLHAQNTPARPSREDRRAEKREHIASMVKQDEEGVLAYYKQSTLGAALRTNGYAAFYEIGRMKSPRFANLYSLEVSEIKHNKEQRFQNVENFFGNSFVFGKIVNFYQVKLGFGQQYIIGQKGNKNGVAVLGIYGAGLSAGLVKPYYVEIASGGVSKDIKFQDDSTAFLSSNILGSSGFSKGLREMTVNPGAYVKAALRFDFGRFNESIQAIELGISADVYSKKVQLMAENPAKQLFVQGHLAFMFGRRR